MSRQPLIDFITRSGLVSAKTASNIADQFASKEISRQEYLLRAGRISDEYFFLTDGFIRSFAHDTDGNEVTTNFYSAGQVVFEVSSFFNRTVSKENFQAVENSQGFYITYQQLNELFHSLPEFREFGRSVLVKGYAALKSRMLSMITETAEQRYELLLKTRPDIFQFAALKHIASYLGITDTSLSRIRKEFAKK